jgi:hypothetical protein
MRPVWLTVQGLLAHVWRAWLTGVNAIRSPLAVTIITMILYPERRRLLPGGAVILPCQRD